MRLKLAEFGGMAPKIEPRKLAEKLATIATNTGFESGALGQLPIASELSAEFGGLLATTRSILRPSSDDTKLAFTTGETTGEAFSSLVAPADQWGRVYYTTALGPRFTVAENYTVGGLKTDPISYKLGIDGPAYQPTVGTPLITGTMTDPVKVAYICTFVDKFGHESAPSNPSTIVEIPADDLEFEVTLTFVAESRPDTNLSGALRRIYRAAFDGSVSTWQFIADVPFALTTWKDTVAFGDEAEALVSADWVPPPKLEQMVPVASNYVAGFIDNILCYSEFKLPHAWPEGYRFPLKYKIVGLKQTQNGLLVATTGKPYWAFGPDPSAAVPAEIDANYPCLSAKSLVDMGGYVMYATQDGLVAVSGGDAKIVSGDYIDRRVWNESFAPASIVAFAYEGQYVFSVGSQWWVFDQEAGFSTTSLNVLPSNLWQAYYDAMRDTTVLLDKTGKAWDIVSRLGGSFTWRSKMFETGPVSFSTIKVLATEYPVQVTLIGDGEENTYSVVSDRPQRVKPLRAEKWQIGISATGRISDVTLAQSPTEFD